MNTYRFGDVMQQYEKQMIQTLTELVAIPSVRGTQEKDHPYGKAVSRALQYVLDIGTSWGLKVKNIGNYAGHVEYGEGDSYVGVLVHLDVVPAGDGWKSNPFSLTKEGNLLIGRGASDNKGPAVAALYALKAMKDLQIPVSKRVRVIFGGAEETGMDDMHQYFLEEPLPEVAFVPDVSYPTVNREKGILQVKISQKEGSTDSDFLHMVGGDAANKVPSSCTTTLLLQQQEQQHLLQLLQQLQPHAYHVTHKDSTSVTFETHGVSSHGATPHLGINAISLAIPIVKELCRNPLVHFLAECIGSETDGKSLGIAMIDELSGDLTINMGKIIIGDSIQEVLFDIRYPVTQDKETIMKSLSNVATTFSLQCKEVLHIPPLYVQANHPLIQALQSSYALYEPQYKEPIACSGGTYARTLEGRGVAFGGVGGKAHEIHEYIEIDSFSLHSKICAQAMYELATRDMSTL